jgi:hypothetical protein
MQSNSPNKTRLLIFGLLFGLSALSAHLYLSQTPNHQSLFSVHETDPDLEEIEKEYINFLARFQKSYASKTETLHRFQVFKDNYRVIKAHNSLGEGFTSFTMEVNKFADLSDREFEEKYIGQGI